MSKEKQKKTIKKLPSKTTLNLVVKVKTLAHPTRLIPILLLIFVGAALFAQFAVIRRLNQVKQAEAELEEMRNLLTMTQNAYADYDEVEEEYNKYTYDNFDRSLFNRLDILDLIERRLFPVCTVQSLSISHNTTTSNDVLSMTVTGPTLEETYALVSGLLTEPMVQDVDIASYVDNSENAGADQPKSTVTMTITLIDATTLDERIAELEEAKSLLDGALPDNAEADEEVTAPEPEVTAAPEATESPDGTSAPETEESENGGEV